MIREARNSDLQVLREIERAAGHLFRSVGMEAIADDEPATVEELARYAEAGRAWVIAFGDDQPVAYLLIEVVDDAAHIDQVSVHSDHQGGGLGRSLIEHAAEWATQARLAGLTLTTFAEVPWNALYYERCGFRRLPEAEITPGLQAIRQREAAAGLDAWPRVCMRRDL